MSHTDPILENVLAGETYLIDDIYKLIEEKYSDFHPEEKSSAFSQHAKQGAGHPGPRQWHNQSNNQSTDQGRNHDAPVMVSQKLIYFARIMNPF